MINKTIVTNQALKAYFDSLKAFGYVDYDTTSKVLILTYLNNLFLYQSDILTDEDILIIEKYLYALIESDCMIGFPA